VDEGKRSLAAELTRAAWAEPAEALVADVDVLAPCALGGVLDERTVPRVGARVICGAANNQLADDGLAADLAARGVVYAPDFVANAGGVINVAAELEPGGYDPERTRVRVAQIEDLMAAILAEAEADGTTPLAAAVRHALERHQPAECRLGQRRQVYLADAAPGEGLHRPRALEAVHLDERVEHRDRADAVGHGGGQLEADGAADVVHHEVEAIEAERV